MGHFIEGRSIHVKIYLKNDVSEGEGGGFKCVSLVCQICYTGIKLNVGFISVSFHVYSCPFVSLRVPRYMNTLQGWTFTKLVPSRLSLIHI